MTCDAGGGGSSGQSQCSGNGECLSMAELALRSNNNGDATNYTYGTDPNNAFTWDGKRIFGCICDEGWEGNALATIFFLHFKRISCKILCPLMFRL